MEHVFFHSLIELGVDISIRDLSRDEGVYLFHSANLVIWFQEDEKVHMRQTTLLIFNGVHQSCHLSIVAFANLLQQGLLLLIEYASHQVWTVHSSLTYMKKFVRIKS
jgi:hypothetical protein